MKSFLRIIHGAGIAPSTERVALCDAESETAADSHLQHEARALIEFAHSEEIPTSLLDGAYVHMSSGPTDEHDGCTVEVYRAVAG